MVVNVADCNDNMSKEDAIGGSILIFSVYLFGYWEQQWLGLGVFLLPFETNK